MILGFIGTGKISYSIITGICNSKIKIKIILISPRNRTLSQKQISTINSFVEEHLSCFVLLGYTVDGDPVSLLNANTQKDSDSLGTLLQKFMAKNVEPPSIPPMI